MMAIRRLRFIGVRFAFSITSRSRPFGGGAVIEGTLLFSIECVRSEAATRRGRIC